MYLSTPADLLAKWLVEAGYGSGTAGVEWYVGVGTLPDTPNNVIAVSDGPGISQGDQGGQVVERTGLQIRTRSYGYKPGYKKLRTITLALDEVECFGVYSSDDGRTYRMGSFTRGTVVPMGQETEGARRHHFSLNILCSVTPY